jgi:hypothetical protein
VVVVAGVEEKAQNSGEVVVEITTQQLHLSILHPPLSNSHNNTKIE